MSPLVRIGRALAGLIGGTVLTFAALVLGYVLFAGASGLDDGDFGLGFGLVVAPALALLTGLGLGLFMAISRRPRRADRFLLVALIAAILLYVAATALD